MDLKIQTGTNSVGSLVLLGFQWLISVCLVRIKGYEDAGIFSLAMTVANVFSTMANYGLRNYQITDHKRLSHQQEYLLMRLASSIAALIGCSFYLFCATDYTPLACRAILLYLLYNLAIVISDSVHGSIQLKGHLEYNGYSNIMRGALCFALFLGALLFTQELIPALAAMALGSFLILLLYDLPCYRKLCRNEPETSRRLFIGTAKLYAEGFPVMISALIPMMVTAYPRTSIQRLLGAEMLGYFSSVYTPAVILSTAIPPALIAFLPGVSTCWQEKDRTGLLKSVFIEYGIVFMLVTAAYLGAALLGGFFLALLYGSSIRPYAGLLRVAILSVGMSCVCVCGNNIMVALGGKAMLALMSCLALLVTWCLAERLVSIYGIAGAAFVQMAAYGIQAAVQAVYLGLLIHRRFR